MCHVIIIGVVERGRQLGRQLGFPTANIHVSDCVASGVYLARVTVDGQKYFAMVNIGTRPTVSDAKKRNLEAHLFDFSQDLYGKELTVELLRFIRAEEKFESLEELQNKIMQDKLIIKKILDNDY